MDRTEVALKIVRADEEARWALWDLVRIPTEPVQVSNSDDGETIFLSLLGDYRTEFEKRLEDVTSLDWRIQISED